MNTIERVAFDEDFIKAVFNGDDSDESFLRIAKAAIEALGVIILPVDAEPQEGDLCEFGDGDYGLYSEADKKGNPYFRGVEIIQRDGTPVIHERE